MREYINKYTQYEKEARRLIKRSNEIIKEIRNQPFIEVTPFQKGWETSIVLREDIQNRDDADFIQHLIDIGYQDTKHIRSLKHVKMIRQGIYVYHYKWNGQSFRENFIPDKIRFSEQQYEKLSDREKKYFSKDLYYLYYHSRNQVSYYINIPDYWIKLKVKPCMYDRIMDKNGELESEYAEIENKLQNPPYSKYYYRGGHRGRYYSEIQNRIRLGKLQLKEGLEEYYEND